jgi:ABC-type dipeptide/oligopeptide/nickel transport system permease component
MVDKALGERQVTKTFMAVLAKAGAMAIGVVMICLALKIGLLWAGGEEGVVGDWKRLWTGGDADTMRAIGVRLPASLALYGVALLLCLGIGVPLGRCWGGIRWSWLSAGFSLLVAGIVAIPVFWLGAMGVYYFGSVLELPILPARVDPALVDSERVEFPRLWNVLVPALGVGLTGAALVAGRIRRNLVDAALDPSIEVLKARGFGFARRVAQFAVPAAGLTLGRLAGEMLPVVMGLSVAMEWALYFPGIGEYAGRAMRDGDGGRVLLVALVAGLLSVVIRLVIEMVEVAWNRTRSREA